MNVMRSGISLAIMCLLSRAHAQMPYARTIAERSVSAERRVAIVIDNEDHIYEVSGDGRSRNVISALGTLKRDLAGVDIGKLLPTEEAAFDARRILRPGGAIDLIVLAWSFSKTDHRDVQPYCFLHVFRIAASKTESVLTEQMGVDPDQFIIRDVNNDGIVEVLVSTRDTRDETMDIYELDSKGNISKLQSINAESIHTNLGRYMVDVSIVARDKSSVSSPGKLCAQVTTYTWSDSARKFVVTKDASGKQ